MMWQPSGDEREAGPAQGVPDADANDPAWDELLGVGYGRRFWNVGCG